MLDVESERIVFECFIWSMIFGVGAMIVCCEVWSAVKMLAKCEKRQKK